MFIYLAPYVSKIHMYRQQNSYFLYVMAIHDVIYRLIYRLIIAKAFNNYLA